MPTRFENKSWFGSKTPAPCSTFFRPWKSSSARCGRRTRPWWEGNWKGLDQPDELAFAGVISASQHYFGVYDHTAYLLGTLEPDSGKKIIDTYVNLKLFFDELNTFQRLTSKHQEVRLKSNVNLYEAREVRQEHESFFAYLKKRHFQVKGLVVSTLEMLKEFISLGERARTAVTFKI
jgi:hypothetical protein